MYCEKFSVQNNYPFGQVNGSSPRSWTWIPDNPSGPERNFFGGKGKAQTLFKIGLWLVLSNLDINDKTTKEKFNIWEQTISWQWLDWQGLFKQSHLSSHHASIREAVDGKRSTIVGEVRGHVLQRLGHLEIIRRLFLFLLFSNFEVKNWFFYLISVSEYEPSWKNVLHSVTAVIPGGPKYDCSKILPF